MTRTAAAPLQPCNRSRITNGSATLSNVNGSSADARRYRDLVHALTAEVGGDLGEAERLQIRNAATLQLHAETLTAALVRGETIDPEHITRAANGATRALQALRRRRAATKSTAPTPLQAFMAQRG